MEQQHICAHSIAHVWVRAVCMVWAEWPHGEQAENQGEQAAPCRVHFTRAGWYQGIGRSLQATIHNKWLFPATTDWRQHNYTACGCTGVHCSRRSTSGGQLLVCSACAPAEPLVPVGPLTHHAPHSHLPAHVPASQGSVRGYESVEEYDPIERMKRLAAGPAVKSLEEELQDMHSRVDIKNFDYKPVPRTEDE